MLRMCISDSSKWSHSLKAKISWNPDRALATLVVCIPAIIQYFSHETWDLYMMYSVNHVTKASIH